MEATTRLFVLFDKSYSDYDTLDIEKQLNETRGTVVGAGHNRLIVSAPIDAADDVLTALEDEIDALSKAGYLRQIDLPDPSGEILIVNFTYREDGQISSAHVDARHWAIMTAETSPMSEEDAFVALYRDVDISTSYSPESDFDIGDVMHEVRFWDPASAKWDSVTWAKDEPMATITFTAQADLANNGGIVAVDIPALNQSEVSWEMPVRLLGEPDPRVRYDGLALLPCAPQAVRDWARVAPFEIEVDLPEPDNEMTM